jgi:dihydroxy-acid dehydratase
LAVDAATLAARATELTTRHGRHWRPAARNRKVSQALQAYAAFTTSAARGAVRDVNQIVRD